MKYFAGMFVHRIDAKGRVSIPAKFRALLEAQGGGSEMHVFPSFSDDGALDACAGEFYDKIYERLLPEDPMDEVMDDLAMSIFGGTTTLSIDSDGRIVLPPEQREMLGVADQVAFVGRGDRFMLMHPDAAREKIAAARQRSRELHRGRLSRRAAQGLSE